MIAWRQWRGVCARWRSVSAVAAEASLGPAASCPACAGVPEEALEGVEAASQGAGSDGRECLCVNLHLSRRVADSSPRPAVCCSPPPPPTHTHTHHHHHHHRLDGARPHCRGTPCRRCRPHHRCRRKRAAARCGCVVRGARACQQPAPSATNQHNCARSGPVACATHVDGKPVLRVACCDGNVKGNRYAAAGRGGSAVVLQGLAYFDAPHTRVWELHAAGPLPLSSSMDAGHASSSSSQGWVTPGAEGGRQQSVHTTVAAGGSLISR